MTVTYVYDAGALIGAERRSRAMWSIHNRGTERNLRLVVPAPVLAQAWRDGSRQASLARMLDATQVAPMDENVARAAGELMGAAGTSDVVDAVVAVIAVWLRGVVVTSDPDDIAHLCQSSGMPVPRMLVV